jgi:hypothetical protein
VGCSCTFFDVLQRIFFRKKGIFLHFGEYKNEEVLVMLAVFLGWVLVTITYFITFCTVYPFVYLLNEPPTLKVLAVVILLIVPYIIGGIYSGKIFKNWKVGAFWVGLVPMIGERAIIYLFSLMFVTDRGSEWNYLTPVHEIQEALFYFNPLYIVSGILSVVLTMAVAWGVRQGNPGELKGSDSDRVLSMVRNFMVWAGAPFIFVGAMTGILIQSIGLFSAVTFGVSLFLLVQVILFRIRKMAES